VAKYVAVLTVAVLTAMVNLVAMTVTILTSSLSGHLFPDGVSIPLMIEILSLMVLFAAFFSAVLLTITSFARSFKEAQAYLIPIMLLAISPGLLSLMPGVRLTGILAVTPLVNIVLLARDLLEGNAGSPMAAVAVLSTLMYAAAALVLASKVFGNDALLYASGGSWSELFQRPTRARARPTAAATVTCLAVMFPCFFLLSNLAQGYAHDNMSTLVLLNGAVTITVFGVCPWLFAVAQRVRIRSGFHLSGPSPVALLGAACLGLSVWPFAHELFLFGKWTGLVTLEHDRLFELERWFNAFHGLAPASVFVSLAVLPAVLEEWFFRGFLLSGLRDRFTGRQAVVASSLLFGLFHVLTPSMLAPERFLPSTFLGLVLGWVCYRTGSAFPGMLSHACHNGLLLWMVRNRPTLVDWGWNLQAQERIPAVWLAAAVTAAVCGALLVLVASGARRPEPRTQVAEPH
jgi:ABC-2 type transport system permease protein/sodium transport system permease protein